MRTVKSGRLGVLAAVAAVVIGAGGVAYAGAALATPSGARTATANHHRGDECKDEPPGYDTVRPSHKQDDCDEGPEHGTPCPTDVTTTSVEVVVNHTKKKPRDHDKPSCPTATETTSVPTETATSSVPVETTSVPATETATATPTTSEPTPVPTTSTPTSSPTPCDEQSSDDDCGVVTEPPGFAG